MGFLAKIFGTAEKDEKEKKRAEFNIEQYREEPFVCYVERVGPKDARARHILGKLATIDDLHCAEDLHDALRGRYGGGEYKARCFEHNDRSIYLATYNFTLPGDPLSEGRVVEMPEREEKDKAKGKGRVAELQAETEEIEEIRKVEKARAQLKKEKDDYAGETRTTKAKHEEEMGILRSELSDLQASLQQQQEEFEARLEERDERESEKEQENKRDQERREWKEELKQQRDDSDKRFAELLAKLEGDKETSSQTSNLEVLMTAMKTSADAQMEAMKQIADGQRHQSETLVGFLRQPSPAHAEAAQARQELLAAFQTQLAQLRESKDNKIDDFMRMLEVVRTMIAGQGGGDNVWPAVVQNIGSSLTEAMKTFGEKRNALPAPNMDEIGNVVEERANRAVAKAREAIKVRRERMVQTPANPAPPETRAPEPDDPNLVNQVLRIIIQEMETRLDPPTWPQFIVSHDSFPDEVTQAILKIESPDDIAVVVEALAKHGDQGIVSQFVESVRSDPTVVLWLAVGFTTLQELIAASP